MSERTLLDVLQRTAGQEYDPTLAIQEASKAQLALLQEFTKIPIEEITKSTKLLTAFLGLTDGINSNANAVIRNSIEASKGHSAELVDEILERLRAESLSTVKSGDNYYREPPREVIVDGDYAEITDDMLVVGLIDNNYDSFAKANGLLSEDDDE